MFQCIKLLQTREDSPSKGTVGVEGDVVISEARDQFVFHLASDCAVHALHREDDLTNLNISIYHVHRKQFSGLTLLYYNNNQSGNLIHLLGLYCVFHVFAILAIIIIIFIFRTW